MDAAWPRCLERLEAELPAEEIHAWLRPLQAQAGAEGLTLYAPNAFVVDRVREHYLARIRELMAHFVGGPAPVALEVGSIKRADASAAAAAGPVSASRSGSAAPPVAFSGNLDSHYTFDNFVEGRSNQLGRAAAWQAA
ncbi:MAG TPA: DnaA N-terminal domain-containing protein, partial [Arenimonas sp.]|nr:DnaA N-terminal domain-containing protein [Arenimonas sp.]